MGGQYKRTLAQVKVPCATYAMTADNGKEQISALLSSFLGKDDMVDVSSVAGGAGFMSATWLYGCQADMKSLSHLPNFASMVKVQVSGDVQHMFIEIKSLMKILSKKRGEGGPEHDITAAQTHTLQLDRAGLDALIQKGLQVRVCLLSKNELLYLPMGWIVMEVALPSVHIHGIRKSFFLRSSCEAYKLAVDLVNSQGKNTDRMKQIAALVSATPWLRKSNAAQNDQPATPKKKNTRGPVLLMLQLPQSLTLTRSLLALTLAKSLLALALILARSLLALILARSLLSEMQQELGAGSTCILKECNFISMGDDVSSIDGRPQKTVTAAARGHRASCGTYPYIFCWEDPGASVL